VDHQFKFNTYQIDMSELGTWRGIISQLRFVPLAGADGKVEIDYVRFLSHAGGDTSLDDSAE